MPDANIKNEVIKVRIDSATQQLLEQARTYVSLDKSKFIRQSIREKAEAVIAEHETTRFSEEDWDMFFDMIDNPSEPTDSMKRAAQAYKKMMIDNKN